MNFADIWNTSQEDCYILFSKRILSDSSYFLSKYGVKILITSFWDTQYIIIMCITINVNILCHFLWNDQTQTTFSDKQHSLEKQHSFEK